MTRRPDGWWTDVAELQAEVLRLRSARCELDCLYTMGDYADSGGSHCPLDRPCQRCTYERIIRQLEKERDPNLEELDDGVPSRWRILEWTRIRDVADSISEFFRYGGEPHQDVVKLLPKLARMNDDLAHGRPVREQA